MIAAALTRARGQDLGNILFLTRILGPVHGPSDKIHFFQVVIAFITGDIVHYGLPRLIT